MSLKQRLKKKCVEVLSSSSFYGVPKLIASETLFQKLLWATIILAMYAYFTSSIVNNVLEYLKYPVVTNINTVYEKDATFPAVAICNSFLYYYYCTYDNKLCNQIRLRNSNCFDFNTGLNQSLYPVDISKSTVPGRLNGLRLTLYQQKDGEQINIYVYNQSTDLNENKAIYVSKGMEVNIVLNRVFTSKLSSPHSDCKIDYVFEPKPLDILNKTSFPYFQSECFFLCRIQQEMEICNKTAEFHRNFQYYFTNKSHFWDFFYYQVYNDCYKKNPLLINSIRSKFSSLGANTICEKQCPIECNSISYSLSTTSNTLFTNYSSVKIYYEDFFYTLIKEEAKTSFDSLIGTIGGLLGLFLGASLMSFFEIIDLAIIVITVILKHFYHTKNKVVSK